MREKVETPAEILAERRLARSRRINVSKAKRLYEEQSCVRKLF